MLAISTFNPPNIGFFGRPLSMYKNMLPDSFPLNPQDSLLVVPGGPSPILDDLISECLYKSNIKLVDIMYGSTEEDLRELTIQWRNQYFTKDCVNFDRMLKQFIDIDLNDDELRIVGENILSKNNEEYTKVLLEETDKFYDEYRRYPKNFLKGDIRNLDFLHRTFDKIWVTNLLHLYKKDLTEDFHYDAYNSLVTRLNISGSIYVYPIDKEDKEFLSERLIPRLKKQYAGRFGFQLMNSNTESVVNEGLLPIMPNRPRTQYLKITRRF